MRLILRDDGPAATHGVSGPREVTAGSIVLGDPPESATVLSEDDGFVLVDTSRSGARVDGLDLGESQRVRLRHGSRILLGTHRFRAEILDDGATLGRFGRALGTRMPSITEILAGDDPPGAEGERAADAAESTGTEGTAEADVLALAAFLAGANVAAGAIPGDAAVVLRRAGAILAAAFRHLVAAEREMRQLYGAFDAPPPIVSTADLAELLADDAGADLVAGRLETLRLGQGEWHRAVIAVLEEAANATPQAVRAGVDAARTGSRLGGDRAYWRAIVEAHTEEGRPMTPRDRLTAALTMAAPPVPGR